MTTPAQLDRMIQWKLKTIMKSAHDLLNETLLPELKVYEQHSSASKLDIFATSNKQIFSIGLAKTP